MNGLVVRVVQFVDRERKNAILFVTTLSIKKFMIVLILLIRLKKGLARLILTDVVSIFMSLFFNSHKLFKIGLKKRLI